MRRVRPGVVVGDFRLSLSISARLAGIPYVALINAHWSPWSTQRFPLPELPIVNVFQKTPDGIHHSYCSELFFAPPEDGQNPRHVDMLWPLWHTLDLTPGGRGDRYPSLDYGAKG